MRLTIQRLKKLIREEMTRLNEGAATIIILMAYLKHLNSQPTTDASGKALPVKQDVERKRRIVTAVLFLHALAIIMGHMMENVMSDEMSYGSSKEQEAIDAFYAMEQAQLLKAMEYRGLSRLLT